MMMTQMIHGLHFKNIRGDIFGGITAAVVALPLALAFGVASGAGAIAGLYGAIIVGFFAALFGGTPSQVSGPTGPMTVVMTAIIIDYVGKYPDTGLAIAFTVVVLGGLILDPDGRLKAGTVYQSGAFSCAVRIYERHWRDHYYSATGSAGWSRNDQRRNSCCVYEPAGASFITGN